MTDESPEEKIRALERYGRDLTAEADDGRLDGVIGRDDGRDPPRHPGDQPPHEEQPPC